MRLDQIEAPNGGPKGGQSGIERLAEKGQKRGQIWVFFVISSKTGPFSDIFVNSIGKRFLRSL